MSIEANAGRYKRFIQTYPVIACMMHLIAGATVTYVAALLGLL